MRAPGRWPSKRSMTSPRPPNAPKLMPPAIYFPSVVRSGVTPRSFCSPPEECLLVITSSKISRMPASRVAARSATRNSGVAGMQPPEPIIGSRMTAAISPACVRRVSSGLLRVVVVRQRDRYGRIDRASAADERQQSAVIAAPEGKNAGATAEGPRRAERHHVGLGAAVGEAHALERGKARAKQRCELAFPFPDRREIEASIDGGVQGGLDARLGMTEQPRRVLAAEVDVAVTVHVFEEASLAARHRRRERRIEQDRARVAAGQDAARPRVYPSAFRAGRGIAFPGLRQRRIEIAVSLSQ